MEDNKLIEIRWHGRGGQGAVTSAEILALAAFAEGKFAQAFPSFGPERRGAPVLAFNRIHPSERIRTRAAVEQPDIVIVLDPSLLTIVDVTAGLKDNGVIIVNSPKTIAEIQAQMSDKWRLAVVDATSIARELLKVNIVNTTMLGAVVKATGVVKLESLTEPIVEKFGARGKSNFAAAERAYRETVVAQPSAAPMASKKTVNTERLPTWQEMAVGCVVSRPGSAAEYRTGDWRSQRPIWDKSKCVKCGICYLFCPEFCVREDKEGYFDADLYHCKGCGICARECWTQAISMVEEVV